VNSIVKLLRAEESKFRGQLEAVRAAIDILKNGSKGSKSPGRKKRRVSRAARAKMARAQKARWRKIKAEKKSGG
jgi:hypothetical protein